jgi:hypothetical protein
VKIDEKNDRGLLKAIMDRDSTFKGSVNAALAKERVEIKKRLKQKAKRK